EINFAFINRRARRESAARAGLKLPDFFAALRFEAEHAAAAAVADAGKINIAVVVTRGVADSADRVERPRVLARFRVERMKCPAPIAEKDEPFGHDGLGLR